MIGFRTTPEKIAKWSRQKPRRTPSGAVPAWGELTGADKVVRALSDDDPAVRAAAAAALATISTEDMTSAGRDAVVPSLTRCLRDGDPAVATSAARELPGFGDCDALVPLAEALDRSPHAGTRAAALDGILGILRGTEAYASIRQTLAATSHKVGLSRDTVDLLLYAAARRSIELKIDHANSPIGDAFVDCGPKAGRQLVRAGQEMGDPWAVRFGTRIVEGQECGAHHTPDDHCVCTRCGETVHDFSPKCVCRYCGYRAHDFSGMGVVSGYLNYCRRCGRAYMHVQSGNVTELDPVPEPAPAPQTSSSGVTFTQEELDYMAAHAPASARQRKSSGRTPKRGGNR
ncbi:hypothetical protein GCM10010531_34730 [Blastococcus jejuensis]|uniref:HEAT repeat-containing protein n=1 Tax=Blastococcus jejuensis TaxID=351224 RepID=A0ABP6PIU3_9ACTN